VSTATPLTPADRFAAILDALCRAVAARGGRGWMATPLVLLIWGRLRRMATRFAGLAARPRPAAPPAAVTRKRPSRPPGPPRLSRVFGLLPCLLPEAASAASQLQHLLADPEMAALLAATPQLGRVLHPLCRMLGLRPAPGQIPPPPARPRATPRDPALHPAEPETPPLQPPGLAPAPPLGPCACGPPVAA
jgi:hypothetical protein